MDARVISEKFSVGLDLLTIVVETPPQACINYASMNYLNEFSWYMRNVDGVREVQSAAFTAKQIAAGWNEGNLKWRALPRNPYALVQAVGPIPSSSGLIDVDCTLLPLQVFLIDGKATTIHHVVDKVKEWMRTRGFDPVLSAGRNNGDRIMPPEFLADGKPRREPAKPTSTWTLEPRPGRGPRLHGAATAEGPEADLHGQRLRPRARRAICWASSATL